MKQAQETGYIDSKPKDDDAIRLTVPDRLLILNGLPAEGDITALKSIRVLREQLSFDDQEAEDLELFHPLACANKACGFTESWAEDRGKARRADEVPMCPVCSSPMRASGVIAWNPEKDKTEKEIFTTRRQRWMVSKWLRDLSASKKLTEAHLDLWAMFCEWGDIEEEFK
jgi:hypothetical protein